jgi:hypothetical protein
MFKLLGSAFLSIITSCAGGPRCDFTAAPQACTASVEPAGNAVTIRGQRCSEVDVLVDGKPRTVRASERGTYVAGTESEVEITECRIHPDR